MKISRLVQPDCLRSTVVVVCTCACIRNSKRIYALCVHLCMRGFDYCC